MRKFYLLLALVGVLVVLGSIPQVLAYQNFSCYQETANVSTTCGGLSGGSYTISNTSGTIASVYLKPLGATNNTKIQYNVGSYYENMTLPIACWNAYSDKIIINTTSSISYFSAGNYFIHTSSIKCEGQAASLRTSVTTAAVFAGSVTNCQNKYIDGNYTSGCAFYQPTGYSSTVGWIDPVTTQSSIYEEGIYWDIVNVTMNQNNYTTPVLESSSNPFRINISYNPLGYDAVTSILIYNNTNYTASLSYQSGYDSIWNTTATAPNIAAETNVSFRWYFTFTKTGYTSNFISNFTNQTVTPLALDNCTTNTIQIFNYTLLDEDSLTWRLNGTIEVAMNLLTRDRSALVSTMNATYPILNGGPARVCMSSSINNTYVADYQVKYVGNASYVTEYKFGQNISISNASTTQNINLYDLLSARSTTFTIRLQDRDASTINGAIIDAQRQYVYLNQFISIESPLTNSYGQAEVHLIAEEAYYNFVVTKNGRLLGTFNNYQTKCQNVATGECTILLNLIQATATIPDFQTRGNISTDFDWNPTSRLLSFAFISSDNLVHNVSWTVVQGDNWGNTTICTTSAIATTGTFQCTIPVSYGNSSVIASIYSDGKYLGASPFYLGDSSGDIFGGTKVILGMLMYATIGLMMIASPMMMIFGAMLGMIFAAAFHAVDASTTGAGTFLGNTSIILWFIVAGFVLVYYMTRKS